MNGTSPATALTVGAVAMARMASGGKLSARDTVRLVKRTAYQHTDLTRRQMGAGLLDFEKLLTEAERVRNAE
ncbi:MAG: hypothetical protein R2857_00995 [Vampirovibrionales bacterium]